MTRNWNFGKTIKNLLLVAEFIILRLCQQIIGVALSKIPSMYPEDHCVFFFWKKVCVHFLVRKLSKKNLNFWEYVFGRVVVTALYMCGGFFQNKMFFWEIKDFPKLFLDVERLYWGRLLKNFAVALLPKLSACAKEVFAGQFFWKKNNLFNNFCVLSQKKFIVCQKYFSMVAAIAIQMSWGISFGKNRTPEKLCIFKKFSGFSAKCLWTIVKRFSADLPHLHCTCADDFFWIIYNFIQIF